MLEIYFYFPVFSLILDLLCFGVANILFFKWCCQICCYFPFWFLCLESLLSSQLRWMLIYIIFSPIGEGAIHPNLASLWFWAFFLQLPSSPSPCSWLTQPFFTVGQNTQLGGGFKYANEVNPFLVSAPLTLLAPLKEDCLVWSLHWLLSPASYSPS